MAAFQVIVIIFMEESCFKYFISASSDVWRQYILSLMVNSKTAFCAVLERTDYLLDTQESPNKQHDTDGSWRFM